jgi:hypothetical protein
VVPVLGSVGGKMKVKGGRKAMYTFIPPLGPCLGVSNDRARCFVSGEDIA